jgi:hypothetical protein
MTDTEQPVEAAEAPQVAETAAGAWQPLSFSFVVTAGSRRSRLLHNILLILC